MAGLRFRRLVEAFAATLERHGATVIALDQWQSRPASFRVISAEGSTDCIVFLWTITPGGGGLGVRPAHERRIQVTSKNRTPLRKLPLRPGVRTLLGGWSEEFGVYAFWDERRHTEFAGKSPSLQVDANTLQSAGSVGIATQLRPTRGGQEVVVAVAEGSLLWYVQNGLGLHNSEIDATAVEDLVQATPEEERAFLDEASSEAVAARRYDLVELMRAYRDAQFRPAVLRAYSYKCAVCDCDLKLVDAAHIVPVSHVTGTDEVTNGIALCRLHHGAFDNALLGVQSNYSVVLNPLMIKRLHELQLDRGLEEFRAQLPERVRVPSAIEARPLAENLRLGLQLRRWPESHIA